MDHPHKFVRVSVRTDGPPVALLLTVGSMRKIQRRRNGEVVFTVSGRLEAGNISELSELLTAEPADRPLVLDLKDVVLVNRDVIRFLRACEADGIELRNCPPYIRAWITQEAQQA